MIGHECECENDKTIRAQLATGKSQRIEGRFVRDPEGKFSPMSGEGMDTRMARPTEKGCHNYPQYTGILRIP
jgi:hypothetical protein